jgi:hypothetical protein
MREREKLLAWWSMPVISGTQETKAEGLRVLGKGSTKTLSQKNKKKKDRARYQWFTPVILAT